MFIRKGGVLMSSRGESIMIAVLLALIAAVMAFLYIEPAGGAPSDYHYKLKGQAMSFPDVMVELSFKSELSPEEKQAVCDAISDNMFKNIEDEENHYLHYMDAMNTGTTDRKITLYVDFGCNDGTGLDVLLSFLDNSFEELEKVILS
ncbi:MAG: hypothetical protein ACI4J8_10470 [Oscillospiraceae bacterium]